MGLTFPDAPTLNQRITDEGRSFVWNGSVWLLEQESIPWATLEQALAGLSADSIMSPAAMLAVLEAAPPPALDIGALRCGAWAILNGQTATIIASRNVSSAALVGTGSFSLTFTTPMPNDQYLIHGIAISEGENPRTVSLNRVNLSTAQVAHVTTGKTGGSSNVGAVERSPLVHVAVFL